MPVELTQRDPGGSVRTAVRGRPGAVLLLVAVCLPLFFVGLGSVPLLDPDEPYYAVPASEMIASGSWLVPVFQGRPWFDKPILFYWVVLASFKVLGISAFSARFGSAVAATAGVLLTRSLALRLGLGRKAALAAALVLAANLEYATLARAAVTDMTLTLAFLLCMAAAAAWLERGRLRWAALAGAAVGLAALTKGPVGVLIPAAALGLYAVLARRGDFLRPAAWAAGAAGALATAGPWYAYMALAHRDLLVGKFLVEGNLGRFVAPEHPTGPWFYLVVFAAGLVPWSGALPGAFVSAVSRVSRRAESGTGRPPGILYALCWFVAVVAVFALPASRLASYVLPAFPPAALLIAAFWDGWFERRGRSGAAAGIAVALSGAVALAFAVGLGLVVRTPSWHAARAAAAVLGAVLVGGAVVGALAVRWRRYDLFLTVRTGAAIAMMLAMVFVAAPGLESSRSGADIVRRLEGSGLAGAVAGTYRVRQGYSLDFYLGRTLDKIDSPDALHDRALSEPDAVWIATPHRIADPAFAASFDAEVLATTPAYSAFRVRVREGGDS